MLQPGSLKEVRINMEVGENHAGTPAAEMVAAI